jgi:3-deoxy-7-phosphoheptulonate synthase
MVTPWSPASWRSKPIVQVPEYPDKAALAAVEAQLQSFPPLVFAGDTDGLRRSLAEVAEGRAFLLQGGDCAEGFCDHGANQIREFFKLFMQMAVMLSYAGGLPVVKVGRIAGQFAKPRSSPTETRGDQQLPRYRGDIINSEGFTAEGRLPDPLRQLEAYRKAAATLNLLRAFSEGGYGSLDNVMRWLHDFEQESLFGKRHRAMAEQIQTALQFMCSYGITAETVPILGRTTFYTSHECLLLSYEESLVRRDEARGSQQWYGTSGHMLWIGDRTRQPDHAHVELLRGLRNPIGVKCGPSLDPDGLMRLIDILNPMEEPGRLTFICRLGADRIGEKLPQLIRRVEQEGRKVVWSCDPMHENTILTSDGYKTRPFDRIVREAEAFFDIHRAEGSHAGGIHVEMTGLPVTECTGGATVTISEEQLKDRYATLCDPRLNAAQSLELALIIAERLNCRNASHAAIGA